MGTIVGDLASGPQTLICVTFVKERRWNVAILVAVWWTRSVEKWIFANRRCTTTFSENSSIVLFEGHRAGSWVTGWCWRRIPTVHACPVHVGGHDRRRKEFLAKKSGWERIVMEFTSVSLPCDGRSAWKWAKLKFYWYQVMNDTSEIMWEYWP